MSLEGYRGRAKELLEGARISVGDTVRVRSSDGEFTGILMPRYEYAGLDHVVLKLENGYNIGLRLEKISELKRVAEGAMPGFTKPPLPPLKPHLPRVAIISTGGTIASRVDYRTGGVRPALTAEELYSGVPELAEYAQIEAEVLFSIYSENMTSRHWSALAEKVAEKIRSGVAGVVITHGTDTMGYTAAALSFSIRNPPVPILLVGAQRSSDRPSSDAATNLIGAVKLAAEGDFSGVFVAMHAGKDDDLLALHRGCKVRKDHTSRRDAFESVNSPPALYLRKGVIERVSETLRPRGRPDEMNVMPRFEDKVALVKYHPDFPPSMIRWLVETGYRGIVYEGTGLGHIGRNCFEAVEYANSRKVLQGMTSQCIWGRVNMNVYETGRDLSKRGVIPMEDMLPETALVKTMWVLGNAGGFEEARSLMLANLAGEIEPGSPTERRPEK